MSRSPTPLAELRGVLVSSSGIGVLAYPHHGRGLDRPKGLTQVRLLDLGATKIIDAGLANLKGFHSKNPNQNRSDESQEGHLIVRHPKRDTDADFSCRRKALSVKRLSSSGGRTRTYDTRIMIPLL